MSTRKVPVDLNLHSSFEASVTSPGVKSQIPGMTADPSTPTTPGPSLMNTPSKTKEVSNGGRKKKWQSILRKVNSNDGSGRGSKSGGSGFKNGSASSVLESMDSVSGFNHIDIMELETLMGDYGIVTPLDFGACVHLPPIGPDEVGDDQGVKRATINSLTGHRLSSTTSCGMVPEEYEDSVIDYQKTFAMDPTSENPR